MQIKMKKKLDLTLPETITIGLFSVNIKYLKKLLVEKRNDLANLLLRTHTNITCEQLELCCTEYRGIYIKLGENPKTIEHVFEIREWIETLPVLIRNQSEVVKRLFMVGNYLDTFYCCTYKNH